MLPEESGSEGRWLWMVGSNPVAEITTAALLERSAPVAILMARSRCTVEPLSTVRATKYMVPVLASMTGVPTMPMLPLKSRYGLQLLPTSVLWVGRPPLLELRCHSGTPAVSASKAYTLLLAVATKIVLCVPPAMDNRGM